MRKEQEMEPIKVWVEIRMWGGLNSCTEVHTTLEGAKKSFKEFSSDYTPEEIEELRQEGEYECRDDYMHLYDSNDRHNPEIIIESMMTAD